MNIQPIRILPHPFPIQPQPIQPPANGNPGPVPPWLTTPITIQPWPLPNTEG